MSRLKDALSHSEPPSNNSEAKEKTVWVSVVEFAQGEFESEGVKQAILHILPSDMNFGFRAVSELELQSIKNTGAVGSEPEKASLVKTETLYTTNVIIALKMFDGSQYGPTDTRHTGGYIVVFKSEQDEISETASLIKPLLLSEIYTFLKVDVILPDYSDQDLEEYENRFKVSYLKTVEPPKK